MTNFDWHAALHVQIWNNSLLAYILSVATFLGIWLSLWTLKHFGLIRIKQSLQKRHHMLEGFIFELNRTIYPVFLVAIAMHFALARLHLGEKFEKNSEFAILLITIFQLTLIADRLVSYLIMNGSFGGKSPLSDLSLRSTRLNLKALGRFAIWTTGLLFLLSNLGIDVTTFVTGLGIGGIAIALAAQSVLGDVFSSFTIALDKPFEVGTSIQLDQTRGTIEHIGLKTTRIRSLSGEVLVVPNSDLTKSQVRNFKLQYEWRTQFALGVTYDSSTEKMTKIPVLCQTAIESFKNTRFERCVFAQFADCSLNFDVLYYIVNADEIQVPLIRHQVNMAILKAFRDHDISFAFPTRTIDWKGPAIG